MSAAVRKLSAGSTRRNDSSFLRCPVGRLYAEPANMVSQTALIESVVVDDTLMLSLRWPPVLATIDTPASLRRLCRFGSSIERDSWPNSSAVRRGRKAQCIVHGRDLRTVHYQCLVCREQRMRMRAPEDPSGMMEAYMSALGIDSSRFRSIVEDDWHWRCVTAKSVSRVC